MIPIPTGVYILLSPEADDHFLCCLLIEWKVVVFKSHCSCVALPPCRQISITTVVSSANLTVTLVLCDGVQSCVYRKGLNNNLVGLQC